jgi:hypothetical protein
MDCINSRMGKPSVDLNVFAATVAVAAAAVVGGVVGVVVLWEKACAADSY